MRIYVATYLQGIKDQRKENFFSLQELDSKIIEEWTMNYFLKHFYITFGNADQ